MRRTLLPLVALVLLGILGAAPALADDPPPPVFPSGLPGPDVVPGDVKPSQGPTYVVSPGSSGTALPAPSTRLPASVTSPATPPATPGTAQVDDARQALERVGRTPSAQVAPPTAVVAAQEPGTHWWLIGSGLLLALILIEARVVTGRVTRDAASR